MGEVTAEYLKKVRTAARVDEGDTDLDEEIKTLILAARKELHTAGIAESKCKDETDPQILRAVFVFVKAERGLENPDREKYLQSFETIKLRLALSVEYTMEAAKK